MSTKGRSTGTSKGRSQPAKSAGSDPAAEAIAAASLTPPPPSVRGEELDEAGALAAADHSLSIPPPSVAPRSKRGGAKPRTSKNDVRISMPPPSRGPASRRSISSKAAAKSEPPPPVSARSRSSKASPRVSLPPPSKAPASRASIKTKAAAKAKREPAAVPSTSKPRRPRASKAPPAVVERDYVEASAVDLARRPLEITTPSATGDHLDDHFFRQGETGADGVPANRNPTPMGMELDPREERLIQKLTPGAQQRRAQLARYVKAAVGISAVLCLAALVKVAIARNHSAEAEQQAATAPAATASADTPSDGRSAVLEGTALAAVPPPASAAGEEPAPQEPSTASSEGTRGSSEDWPEVLSPEEALKLAKEEKNAARMALERNDTKKAIAEGEKSVSHAPTDSEAWLILGAAYQAAGNMKDATRCYAACLKEGKGGPKGECAAMLRR